MKSNTVNILLFTSFLLSSCSSLSDTKRETASSFSGGSGKGEASVFMTQNGPIVSIDGDAASVLYDSLNTRETTPTHSSSVIKKIDGVECTKNRQRFNCIIAIQQ